MYWKNILYKYVDFVLKVLKDVTNTMAFSPQANYTD
jgi:hypothetical protein